MAFIQSSECGSENVSDTSKRFKKAGIVILIVCVFLAIIIGTSSTGSYDQETDDPYCSMSDFTVTNYDSEEECLLALFDCKEEAERRKKIIDDEFAGNEGMQKRLEENFFAKADEIINAYSGTLPYSSNAIKKTINEDIGFYSSIRRYYNRGEYEYAFDGYLNLFSKTYVEDCPYYIVKTLYPKCFEEGIRQKLSHVVGGDWGQRVLDEAVTYIDSMPDGRDSFAVAILMAEQQIYDENEKKGITVNGKKPPAIGMTAEEVRDSTWGSPNKINKDTYAWGVQEQWCYSGYRYIYLEDGIVTSISESE